MKITKRQLKKIIREEYSRLKRCGLIKEHGRLTPGGHVSMVPEDVQDVIDIAKAAEENRDFDGWCDFAEEQMMQLRTEFDEEADAFLEMFDLDMGCPTTAGQIVGIFSKPEFYNHPIGAELINKLYGA